MKQILHITPINATRQHKVFEFVEGSYTQLAHAEGMTLADARLLVNAENMLEVLTQIREFIDKPGTECPVPTALASNIRLLTVVLNSRHGSSNHFSTLPLVE